MIHQFDKLTANQTAIENLQTNEKISVMYEYEPRGFEKKGDKMITTMENLKTKEISTLVSDGVFVFIGFKSNVDVLGKHLPEMNSWGYIVADEDMKTSIPGVYAIGDIISKKYRQITTAVADGTIAAITISKELLN
jgi:thioredoxin reductase (NADPH)